MPIQNKSINRIQGKLSLVTNLQIHQVALLASVSGMGVYHFCQCIAQKLLKLEDSPFAQPLIMVWRYDLYRNKKITIFLKSALYYQKGISRMTSVLVLATNEKADFGHTPGMDQSERHNSYVRILKVWILTLSFN